MFKTVRGKLLASSISILIIINIIFTIFIYLYLGNNFQKDMIDEMAKVKSAAVNLMKNDLSRQMQIIIDEKEKIEKLQKSSREFFNNATHELKTPVTAISLYAQTLKENNIKDLEEDFIIV